MNREWLQALSRRSNGWPHCGAVARTSACAGCKPAAAATYPGIDLTIMHVQVLLDHLGFGPGVIDGKRGHR